MFLLSKIVKVRNRPRPERLVLFFSAKFEKGSFDETQEEQSLLSEMKEVFDWPECLVCFRCVDFEKCISDETRDSRAVSGIRDCRSA